MTLFQKTYRNAAGELVAASTWTARIWVRGVEHVTPTGFRDQSAAVRWALDRRTKLERRAAGIEDFDDTDDARLNDLLAEFRRDLERRKLDDDYIAIRVQRTRSMLDGMRSLSEATPARIRARLFEIGQERVENAIGLVDRGPTTQNAYLGALSAFFAWLVRDGRWPRNPVDSIQRARESDPEEPDRALTLPEASALMRETDSLDRRVAYALGIVDGLRRGEVGSLLWSDLDLEAAYLRIRDSVEKARRGAILPLRPRTVELLRQLRAARAAGTTRPRGRPKKAVGWQASDHVVTPPDNRTLRRDLARAAPSAPDLHLVGFHSLRRTTNTGLKDLGYAAAIRKEIMRHADIALTTSQSYTTIWEDELVRPLDALEAALFGATKPGPATGPESGRKVSLESVRSGNLTPETPRNNTLDPAQPQQRQEDSPQPRRTRRKA